MRRWREAIFIILLASVVIPAAPGLAEWLRLAWELRSIPMRARREAVFGDFYRGVEALQRLPLSKPLALIRVSPKTQDQLFINYYIYPHRTTTYWNRWMYATSDEKRRPATIVQVGDEMPRVVSYAELRDFEVRKSRVLRKIELPQQRRAAFVIPLVTSIDGVETYTVEGAMASDEEAHVTLTMQPEGLVKILTIRGPVAFYDLVYQCFRRMQFAAWVQVSSDRPVRAAFWFVNRNAKTAAPIRLIDAPIDRPMPFPSDPTAHLWLLNLGDSATKVRAGEREWNLPPRHLSMVDATGTVTGHVYAFLSRKQPNGVTQFIWPEDLK